MPELLESDPFFLAQREQIVALTAQYSLPAILSDRESIASTRRLFCGSVAQPPASVMRAEHGCAFWATLAGYLSIRLATWIDDINPLGGRYSSLDIDDGCTR
jgi:hypothetical protein